MIFRRCLLNILFPVFMNASFFYCPSFTPSWPLAFLIFSPPLWIFMFFFLRNTSPLFSINRSSSFSVIQVSVNIKNNVEKDTPLLLFFLSKNPGGHAIFFQIKPWVELFYIGMPVVRKDGWSVGRAGGQMTTKIFRMQKLPNFITHGAPHRARENSSIMHYRIKVTLHYFWNILHRLSTKYLLFNFVISCL